MFCRVCGTRGLTSAARICVSRIRSWRIRHGAGESRPGGDMEVRPMRPCVSVCVVVIAAGFGMSAQTRAADPAQAVATGNSQPGAYHHGEAAVPAARYSPLAAQGGYTNGRKSPLDAAVHAL